MVRGLVGSYAAVTQAGAAAAAAASGTGGADKPAAQAGAGKAGAAAAAAKVEIYLRIFFFPSKLPCEETQCIKPLMFEALFLSLSVANVFLLLLLVSSLLRRRWRQETNTHAFCLGLHSHTQKKKSPQPLYASPKP